MEMCRIILGHVLEEEESEGTFSKDRRIGGCHFSCFLSTYQTSSGVSSNILYLPCLHILPHSGVPLQTCPTQHDHLGKCPSMWLQPCHTQQAASVGPHPHGATMAWPLGVKWHYSRLTPAPGRGELALNTRVPTVATGDLSVSQAGASLAHQCNHGKDQENRMANTGHTGDIPGASGSGDGRVGGGGGDCATGHHWITFIWSHYFQDQERADLLQTK